MTTTRPEAIELAEPLLDNAGELERVIAERDELARQARTDPLTGLLNRRGLAEQLTTELARAERGRYPVTVLSIDLDFFKQINDLCGHVVGDEVLKGVAERICSEVRAGDLCGRLGGDEFLIALANADARLAAQLFARIATAVAALEFGPGEPSPSLSAGSAEFPRDSNAPGELMELADGALFRAKAAGRGRLCSASSTSDGSTSRALGSLERHRLNVQNTVEALARAVDARNGYTHRHSHAVAVYAVTLARALDLDAEHVAMIRRAGVLHDVGKIGVPDAILWKEGPLEPDEFDAMRRHSRVGHDILLGAGLPEIADWVAHLHERFDGCGYPDGVQGRRSASRVAC